MVPLSSSLSTSIFPPNAVIWVFTKYKQNMFTLYKRFHTHMEGKGLGLYLVKTQITALGGKIDVESELDKGTIFKVYFKY